jgi:glutathione S-transferase
MAEMIMWISWATHHLNNAGGMLYFYKIILPKLSAATDTGASIPPAQTSVLEEAMGDFRRSAAILDAHLEGRTWLVGDRLSYADFRAATALPFAEGAGLPVAEFPNVKRWHDRLWAIDAWRAPFEGLA